MPVRTLVLMLSIAAALAGCVATPEPIRPSANAASDGPSLPTASIAEVASASPTVISTDPAPVVTAPPPDDAACRLRTQPGPADAAPTEGDLTDWSDIGGGRMRICLGGAPARELEGSALCTWNGRHDTVREVAGVPIQVDDVIGKVDGGVSLERRMAYLGLTGPLGDVSSFEGGLRRTEIRSVDHGRRGIVRFDVSPVVDPENPPAVLQPDVVGLMRWVCLGPPTA